MDLSRRKFIAGAALLPLAGCSVFQIGRRAPRRPPAGARITLAVIGCGTMGRGNMVAFLQDPRVQVVAVCDPVTAVKDHGYSPEHRDWGGREPFRKFVDGWYKQTGCRAVADWREIADDPTIDAVLVTTPDHWHALIAIACMEKGKHVYCQKPMSLGVSEGQAMVRAARASGVTFQVGSQQRNAAEFRVAAEWVRNGYLGDCRECWIGLPGTKNPQWGYGTDRVPRRAPDYFASPELWSLWLGPARHWENDVFIPVIHQPMCWRYNSRTGGGMITDWGAHHVDILQWAIGVERSGPIAIENFESDFDDDPILDWAHHYSFDLVYANGFRAHVSDRHPNGLRFRGAKGEVFVARGKLERPEFLRKWSEKKDLGANEVHLYRAAEGHNHESDFVDGIFGNRPIATDCEIGHRSISACHIANICERLGLRGAKWDPAAERFVGAHAAEANARLEVPHFNGWTI